MNTTKKKCVNTLTRLCKKSYNKYGSWVMGEYIPYEDFDE